MDILTIILCAFLLFSAVAVGFTKSNLSAIVIFSAYSLIMAIIWIIMESPDLAITEAAVGAGVTSILFYATLKKINQIDIQFDLSEKEAAKADSDEDSDNVDCASDEAKKEEING